MNIEKNLKITKYTTNINDQFGSQIKSIKENNFNELIINLTDSTNIPKICLFIYNELHGNLSTIVCTDERNTISQKGFVLRYVFSIDNGDDIFIIVTSNIPMNNNSFPSIALIIPAAFLYEREIMDMFGLIPNGNPDRRPLVLHPDWPKTIFPLRRDFDIHTKVDREPKDYLFTNVEGEGVCEIPVGPVHAGIIEPGHFRFSILGEHIINLETQLFYTHKGIEKLAENMNLEEALLLSERISGDESVANSIAYCQSLERIANVKITKKAEQTRTVFAELERIYNHLGTLAGITTDAGFLFGSSRLNILKEKMMYLNEQISGSRILFGVNRIGGVGVNLTEEFNKNIFKTLNKVEVDFELVINFLRRKSSFIDRLMNTGIITIKTAKELGAVGISARCVGLDIDTRLNHPYAAYSDLKISQHQKTPKDITQHKVEMQKRVGDALSRFEIRIDEIKDSINIVNTVLNNLSNDNLRVSLSGKLTPFGQALGYAESHRGQTMHWIMMGENENIFRYKIRTASFCNWPLIEQAVLDDIIPDFPLINKSFDLSYSGNDL